MDNKYCDRLPVMLYLHGPEDGRKDAIASALQKHFSGRYRIVAPLLDRDPGLSLSLINKLIREESPRLIIGWASGGNLAIRCDRDDGIDVVVVNPLIDESLDDVPVCNYCNVFALCSTKDDVSGDSHLRAFSHDYTSVRVTATDAFGYQIDDAGKKQLFSLIEKVIEYQRLEKGMMNYEEFEDMVRQRPSPDTPGYYSLKVWTYDNDTFSREDVNGQITYRCPLSVRQAEFSTKEEAVAAMQDIIASSAEKVCMFRLSRLPFGRFDETPFWLEAWTFDAAGRIIQESPYSATHYNESGIDGKFFGYLPEKIRWRKGQIVSILHSYFQDSRYYATLAIVVDTPKDTAEGYEDYIYATQQWIRDGNSPATWLEMTGYPGSDDDEMFLQFGPYTEDCINFTFDNPLVVFPAPADLTGDVKAELRSWYDDYTKQNQPESTETKTNDNENGE